MLLFREPNLHFNIKEYEILVYLQYLQIKVHITITKVHQKCMSVIYTTDMYINSKYYI